MVALLQDFQQPFSIVALFLAAKPQSRLGRCNPFYRLGRRRSILRANRSLLDRQIVFICLDFIATGR